jgi:hypothetical protein
MSGQLQSDLVLDFEAWIAAMGPIMGLTIAPEFRPGVVANLSIAARFAELLTDFPLHDESEPAPVFRA